VAAGKPSGVKIDLDNSTQELGRSPPIGRVADAAEPARCIRFLASDDASYVVGAVFSADGGSTAHSGSIAEANERRTLPGARSAALRRSGSHSSGARACHGPRGASFYSGCSNAPTPACRSMSGRGAALGGEREVAPLRRFEVEHGGTGHL